MAIARESIMEIIKPFLNDENSADIVEAITKADVVPDGGITQADVDSAVTAAITDNNKAWNQRFREAFLTGGKETVITTEQDVSEETPEEVNDYDDIFEEVKE